MRASINFVLVVMVEESTLLEMETDSMEAIVDSFPSIREERPVVMPVGRDRAAFWGMRRDDDRRDMLFSNVVIDGDIWCLSETELGGRR